MMRYAAIPWPWAGLIVAGALVGQEALLTWLGTNPTLAQTTYRMLVWSVAVASLALIVLPPRRVAYMLGFLTCAALIGWALWLQYGLDLEPCPLCIFQRVAVIATGIVFLIAAVQNPQRRGAVFYAILTVLVSGIGAALAAWHVWIQGQPQGTVPSCGMGLNYMLETLPLTDVIGRVLKGSGECAEQGWLLLGLAIPSWTFVFFIAMIAASIALIRRD
ncbi:MAG: disulfide bond formation protein B [Betaproteobacteria bacterium]